MTDTDPHADIRQRHATYLASPVHKSGFTCCTAHATADDVPALLAEIDRLRAELADARQQAAEPVNLTPICTTCRHSLNFHAVSAPHSCFANTPTCECSAFTDTRTVKP